jgi:hypothetical protein
VDVVRDLKVPPEQVASFYRDWQSMKDSHSKKTTLESRVEALERTLALQASNLENFTWGGTLANVVEGLRARLSEIPIPPPDQHVCPRCQKSGPPVATTKCIYCNSPMDWVKNPAS